LKAGSPAIGAGYNFSSLFTTDLAGDCRPASGAWDLGAYNSGSASALGLPAVSVTATTNAARVGLISGMFTLTRAGSTTSALTVNYSLAGTAASGADYSGPGTSAIIPAGASSVIIPVVPLPSANCVGVKSAVLTLATNKSYAVTPANNASVVITGNSLPGSLNVSKTGALIKWPSVAGKIYRVAYKNDLADTSWANLSSLITATGATASYNDATAGQHASRYYVVFLTD
jgi:hypothetical protein